MSWLFRVRDILFLSFIFAPAAKAGVLVETSSYYSKIGFAPTPSRDYSDIFSRIDVYMSPQRQNSFFVGAGFDYRSKSTLTGTTTETFSGTNYHFSFKLNLTPRTNWFWLGASYSPSATANYSSGSSGSTAETWQGIAYAGSISLYFPNAETWKVGVGLEYQAYVFSKKVIGTTTTSFDNNQTNLHPSLILAYLW